MGVLAAARRALAPILLNGWRVDGVRRLGDEGVLVDLLDPHGLRLRVEWHTRGEEPMRACRGGIGLHHWASLRGGPGVCDPYAPSTDEALRSFAEGVAAALASVPEPVDLTPGPAASAGGDARIELSADVVEQTLAPLLGRVDSQLDGWQLLDVHGFGPEQVAVRFEHATAGPARITLRARDDDRPAAARTRTLDLLLREPHGGGPKPAGASADQRLLDDLLPLIDSMDCAGPGFRPSARATELAGGGGERGPTALNMAILAPCGQRCSFCSIRDEVAPLEQVSPEYLETLRADIRGAAAAGAKILRLNGMEPLNAPYVFELLELARAEGMEEAHILSTCLPLAGAEVADRLFEALPERYRFYVPIYGSCAKVHDEVAGRPGAYAELTAAVEQVQSRLTPGGQIIATTVLVAENLSDVPAMSRRVAEFARWWEVHLPFPNSSNSRDRYRAVAPRFGDVLAALYPEGGAALGEIALGEVPMCTALRHQVATGHRLITAQRIERRQPPSGTFYETAGFAHSLGGGAFTAASLPCPHVAECAFDAVCPGALYAAYVQEFGLDEIRPVSPESLARLPDGVSVAAALVVA